ncbi:MAG: DUF1080 domain-containing protein [Kiritimatiellae bacterium]|nr:DUF1080 domain-containing protein [Kiritimatiellia bacterium]
MKKTAYALATAAAAAAVQAFADPFGAPPDAKHAWAVHDDNRPGVVKITAEEGMAPSDAIVLFDGTASSIEKNWCDGNGKPTKWTVDDNGDLISVRGAGFICTKKKFADCQLHVEWAAPAEVRGTGQGRGNSGVFLPGEFEIQVLDSYETDPSKTPNPNPNYSDGQAGAAYGQNPPLVNPCRAPGKFNTFDIVFHSPVADKTGKILSPATATVFFNGVLVQDAWRFDGPTVWRNRASYPEKPGLFPYGPIMLQDHGNPVHYRNIWIRELAPQGSNAVHGDYYAKEEAVMEQRAKTAAELDERFESEWGKTRSGRKAVEAWRIVSYAPSPERQARCAAADAALLADLDTVNSRDEVYKICGTSYGDLNGWYSKLDKLGIFGAAGNRVLDKLRSLK